jgi:two-component system, OmpR family, response regulator RegX3
VSARILVIDDEPAIRKGLSYLLPRAEFEVEAVATAEDGLSAARRGAFDLIVLDLALPDLSGIEVCRRLRAESTVPILMLTARDSEADLGLGLVVGADDYVTKPFSTVELLGRIRAILRRRELDRRQDGSVRQVGDLTVNSEQHQVLVAGRTVHVTPSEFKLLALLARQPERVFSRREIMEHLWQSGYVGDAHACEGHISSLRRKLERDPANPERIVTVRGVGYKLRQV